MKRIKLIGLAIVTLALLIGIAVPVLAHPGDSNNGAYTGAYIDGPTLARVAEALGLTTEELSADLQTGETLAEIAERRNVSGETVIDAIIAPFIGQLELRVQYGYLTREQADTLLETTREHAATMLEQDLSNTGGNADWWQEMTDYCGNMMGNYGGYGMMGPGMMGGGMMGPGYGYNDSNTGWGTPTPNLNRSASNGWSNIFSRFWHGLRGSGSAGGGMTGGGMMGGGMMGGW